MRWITAEFAGDPRADEYRVLAEEASTPDQISGRLSSLHIWQGKLQALTALADSQRAALRAAGNERQLQLVRLQMAATLAALDRGDAVDDLLAMLDDDLPDPIVAQAAAIAAALGEIEAVRPAVRRLESRMNTTDVRVPTLVARAHIKAEDGQTADAIADLEALLHEFPQGADLHAHIARIKHMTGDLEGAIESYDRTIEHTNQLGGSAPVIIAKFHRAETLVALGRADEAREALDDLLAQWANADTEFWMLVRTREMRSALDGAGRP
jgi:tetratricopeptide (TPR) repeat protein